MAHVLSTLERRLERIRQSHIANNGSTLRTLTPAQRQGVQQLTSAIVARVLTQVAYELEHSAEEQKKELSEGLTVLFRLSD
jgi:glutamyl-tRNA reductase